MQGRGAAGAKLRDDSMAVLLRIRRGVSLVLQWTLGAMLLAMTLTILAQIVARYVLAAPLVWSEELALVLMVWITFVGSALILESEDHVSIDMLAEMAPPRLAGLLALLSAVLIAGFSAALTWGAWKIIAIVKTSTMAGLGVSVAWQYAGVLIGGGLLFLVSCELIAKALRRLATSGGPAS